MIAWYYSKDGQQHGPVSQEELFRLIGTGSVGARDLVWREGMTDWTPAGQVPELAPPSPVEPSSAPVATPAAAGPLNPYQTPESSWMEQVNQIAAPGEEIVPGSQPLDIGDCVKRGFELTKRHFGILLGVGVVYFAVSWVFGFVTGMAMLPFSGDPQVSPEGVLETSPMATVAMVIQNILTQIFGLFIGLGLIRVGLNVVSGKEVSIGMLFGEGSKLMTSVGATILYYLMVIGGTLLLIVPGIYLALRFGQYQNAIVDKNLGVIDSLKYSARITEGNKMNLFGLGILGVLIVIAGLLALIVGVIFAAPVAWLSTMVAYRWLKYGRAALAD
jgi:uncharacterized membrane protein